MLFGASSVKICARFGLKDFELCVVKFVREGDFLSDGKGDVVVRDVFRKLFVFVYLDKYDNFF